MPHAHPAFAIPLRILGLLMCVLATDAGAATCQWSTASGVWTVPANWTGCADMPGPSTRSPGAADIAVIANGIAQVGNSCRTGNAETCIINIIRSILLLNVYTIFIHWQFIHRHPKTAAKNIFGIQVIQ